jgi:hypothetical protein
VGYTAGFAFVWIIYGQNVHTFILTIVANAKRTARRLGRDMKLESAKVRWQGKTILTLTSLYWGAVLASMCFQFVRPWFPGLRP